MFSDAARRDGSQPRSPDEFWPLTSPEYRFQHTLHVRRFIERLQAEEGGDLDVLRTAAIFHDISHFRVGYESHGPASADLLRDYLTPLGYPPGFIDRVHLTVVDHYSDKPESYYRDELPLESQLLIEADVLDKVGPIGVTAHILLCGANRRFWQAIDEYVTRDVLGRGERALKHPLIRLTPTGRRLMEERVAWTRRFLAEMKEDVACVF